MHTKKYIFLSICSLIFTFLIFCILNYKIFNFETTHNGKSLINSNKYEILDYELIFKDMHKSYHLLGIIEKIYDKEYYGSITNDEKRLRDATELEYCSKIKEISANITNAKHHLMPLVKNDKFDEYLIPFDEKSSSSLRNLAHVQKLLIDLRELDTIISMGNENKITEYYSLKKIIVSLLEMQARDIEGRQLVRRFGS